MEEAPVATDTVDDAVVLPPRTETFLARYPRNFKLGAAGTLMLMGLGLWLLMGGSEHYKPKVKTTVFSADKGQSKAEEDTKPAVPAFTRGGTARSVKQAADKPAVGQGTSTTYVEEPLPPSEAGEMPLNLQDDHTVKMANAPDPGLSEDTAEGSLPRVGQDGRQPWQVYARPYNVADKRPRIALVIGGLGLSSNITDATITRMPANVTLAFDVQSPVAGAWCTRARQDGHEVFLDIPMEPFDYPRSDPGPHTLLTTLPTPDNIHRLYWGLRQGGGYVGVTTLSGSRFTTETNKITPIMQTLRDRGLMFLDAHIAPHSAVKDVAYDMNYPAVVVTVRIDQNLSPEALDAALAQLEQTARLTGKAVGLVMPTPIVLEKLQQWLKKLPEHGIALAPVSAMVL